MFKKILIFGAGVLAGFTGAGIIIGIDNEFNGYTVFENDDIIVRGSKYYEDTGSDFAYIYDKRKDARHRYSKPE